MPHLSPMSSLLPAGAMRLCSCSLESEHDARSLSPRCCGP